MHDDADGLRREHFPGDPPDRRSGGTGAIEYPQLEVLDRRADGRGDADVDLADQHHVDPRLELALERLEHVDMLLAGACHEDRRRFEPEQRLGEERARDRAVGEDRPHQTGEERALVAVVRGPRRDDVPQLDHRQRHPPDRLAVALDGLHSRLGPVRAAPDVPQEGVDRRTVELGAPLPLGWFERDIDIGCVERDRGAEERLEALVDEVKHNDVRSAVRALVVRRPSPTTPILETPHSSRCGPQGGVPRPLPVVG